jgi:hypothetical protein
MKIHPLTIMKLKAQVRDSLNLVILVVIGIAIVGGVLSPVIYSRFISDAPVTLTEMSGEIVAEPQGGVFGRQSAVLYRVKLETGIIVMAEGLGSLPAGYRGKVLIQEAHKESGGSMYKILGPYE